MPYDEHVADRLRTAVLRADTDDPIDERKMFGGVALLLRGSMACGVIGSELVVRVGPDPSDDALRQPHARPMDFTGKPLRGFVYVAPAGFASDADLDAWVARGLAGARSAAAGKPARKPSPRKPSPRAAPARPPTARQPRAR
jgi:TfoX/Sxy family transcriptional regulator of competence genes